MKHTETLAMKLRLRLTRGDCAQCKQETTGLVHLYNPAVLIYTLSLHFLSRGRVRLLIVVGFDNSAVAMLALLYAV